jgi:fatty-acyl-CoA synthase
VTIGGSAAPRSMIRFFMERGIRVGHAWGMTEMSPIGTVGAPPADWNEFGEEEKLEYIARQGRMPFGVELRIVDDEGNVLPRDGKASGQLQARGPWIIERYFQDESGPAADPEGWFDTGDVAILHPDGTMQITDRAKDVIKSGGEWISSIELVVKKPGSDVTPDAIRQHLGTCVAKWWLPDEIVFVESLPHTATGKLLKTAIREQYKDYKLATAA